MILAWECQTNSCNWFLVSKNISYNTYHLQNGEKLFASDRDIGK